MATTIRNIPDLKADQAVTELQKLRLDLLKLKVGTIFHADTGTAISTADATNTATAITLVNVIKSTYNTHIASACSATTGQGAHIAADAANAASSANATDEASAITLANEIKGDYNTHRASTSYHMTADATNAVSSANATDEASLVTLVNELKADINAHMAAGFTHSAIALTDP